MTLGKRIQFLRVKYNMTQKELGDKIGISVVSIGGWECETRKPSYEAIIALAKTFNVTTDYLLGVTITPEKDALLLTKSEQTLLSNYRRLDNHGRKVVDTLCLMESSRLDCENLTSMNPLNITSLKKCSTRYIPKYTTPSAAGSSAPLDGNGFEMILVDDTIPSEADFAVSIQGDSMYPYIHNGDTVYVKKDVELSVGDIGIFCVDGVMYCKQYYLDEKRNLILLSANPSLKHTNVFVDAESDTDIRCYGKVLLNTRVDLPEYIHKD